MKRNRRIVMIVIAFVLLLSSIAFAAQESEEISRYTTPQPTMAVINGVATCKARLMFPGKDIEATLELTQGSTTIGSWSDTGYGYLLLSGTANVTPGVTYTLPVHVTVDDTPLSPASITVTP
jgi:hypothetical protein